MRQAIQSILNHIPSDTHFDSHFIISRLIKEQSDTYLVFASKGKSTGTLGKTLSVHGRIGKEIAKFEGKLIQNKQKAWSENIHEIPSKCTSWCKI
jgi:hypothetical protein